MKINLSTDHIHTLEALIDPLPDVENIELDGVKYDLKAELAELRKLIKSILSSRNKNIEVSKSTNQYIVSFVESYIRPCLLRIRTLQERPENINSHVQEFKQEVESGKDFYLENLKIKLDIENIDTNVSLLQEKAETKVTEETIIEASDLLMGTVEFYAAKEGNTFIWLLFSLIFVIFILVYDLISPTLVTDKWMFIQHVTGKITFIIVIGYWVNILARNYKLYSGLHIKNKSRNDVANILLKQSDILQKSNLITPDIKRIVMQSILEIDEGKVEKDIDLNDLEKVSKIVSNLGRKLD